MKNFCVLIPSYNEAKTIGGIVRELRRKGLVVYVVDDGSTDATAQLASREGAIVLHHKTNKGKGASLREGFTHILKKGFEAVLVMDGDNQHEVEDIDNFLARMDETGADIVIGDRMRDTSSMPYIRLHTNQFMSYIISKIAGQYIPDTQCGFRLIKSEALKKLELKSSNYETESELIIKAAKQGLKIESVPVKTIYQDEKSRINPATDTFRFIKLLIRLAFER